MSATVQQSLGEFKSDDLTVKLLAGLYSVVPFSPNWVFYNNIQGAAQRLGAGPDVVSRAEAIAASEDVGKAMWMAGMLDTSDKLIAGYAGVKNLLSFFSSSSGGNRRTFEADPQQALDAGLKATGLAYMTYRLFPGSVGDKVKQFRELDAGKEAAIYFAVGEIALPFADNLAEEGAELVQKLMNRNEGEIAKKFAEFSDQASFKQASEMFGQMVGPLGQYVEQAKGHVNPIADKIKGFLPFGATLMNVADSATGVAATGADLMPVWTLLGARLAAEACVKRAMNGE